MTKLDTNISGISENLSESIALQIADEKKNLHKSIFHGKRIAISVSESEEIDFLGLSNHHLYDVSIELARYFIVNGAKLLYGGDIRNEGFTEVFSELSYQYKYLNDKENRFVNYFPFPTSKKLTTTILAEFIKKQVDILQLQIPSHIQNIDQNKDYSPLTNADDRYVVAECLTHMRDQMGKDQDARVILGGKQTGFVGYYPGIIEEAFYTLKNSKPLYLIGGYGGATRSIISLINGTKPKELTNEFQFQDQQTIQFKKLADKKNASPIDYNVLSDFFSSYGLEGISKLNGLSVEDNQVLFESTNIHEIVFLILKGLKKCLYN